MTVAVDVAEELEPPADRLVPGLRVNHETVRAGLSETDLRRQVSATEDHREPAATLRSPGRLADEELVKAVPVEIAREHRLELPKADARSLVLRVVVLEHAKAGFLSEPLGVEHEITEASRRDVLEAILERDAGAVLRLDLDERRPRPARGRHLDAQLGRGERLEHPRLRGRRRTRAPSPVNPPPKTRTSSPARGRRFGRLDREHFEVPTGFVAPEEDIEEGGFVVVFGPRGSVAENGAFMRKSSRPSPSKSPPPARVAPVHRCASRPRITSPGSSSVPTSSMRARAPES